MSLETDDKEKIGNPVFEYSWWVQMYIMHMFYIVSLLVHSPLHTNTAKYILVSFVIC